MSQQRLVLLEVQVVPILGIFEGDTFVRRVIEDPKAIPAIEWEDGYSDKLLESLVDAQKEFAKQTAPAKKPKKTKKR